MATLEAAINRSELPEEEKGDYSPIPEGWYNVKITDASLNKTKAGTGEYIKVEYTVSGENFSGRRVWDLLNIRNPSEKAEEIGRRQLSSLMSAIGLETLNDTDELVGADLKVKVKIKPAEGDYSESNGIGGFKALGEKPAQGNSGASESKPPWQK